MKAERLDDAMLFDFEALWASDHVKLMSGAELAVYVRLLSCQWREGDLPADPRLLALRASHGTRTVTPDELFGPEGTIEDPYAGSIWAALWPCYESGVGHVWNPRVRADRASWLKKKKKWAKKSSAAGKASAEARRARHKSTSGQPLVEPVVQPQEHSLSPSPPSPPLGEEKSENEDVLSRPPEDGGRERVPSKAERDFEILASIYPNPTKKAKARAAWCRLKAADRDLAQAKEFLEVAVVSRKWTEDDGRYIPGLWPFVTAKTWQDDTRAYPPAAGNGSGYARDGPAAVDLYVMRKARLDGLRTVPQDDRDPDEQDDDLDRLEESLRGDLQVINADHVFKAELKAYLESS